jgi:hypothetical protein
MVKQWQTAYPAYSLSVRNFEYFLRLKLHQQVPINVFILKQFLSVFKNGKFEKVLVTGQT